MSSSALKLLAASGAKGGPLYVDDVFSSFRYQGNDSTNQIVNGIDLAGEGGLVWQKARSNYSANHLLTDTVRGKTKILSSNLTTAEITSGATNHISSFNSDGFTLGGGFTAYENFSGIVDGLIAWTFRKAPGFFDIVTHTGTGTAGNRTIPHNLGSVPGMIVVKDTAAGAWYVWHRSYTYPLDNYQILNGTNGVEGNPGDGFWGSSGASGVTSTGFSISGNGSINTVNNTFVAYLFAHDAQDFGTDSDEAIVKCGSFVPSSTWGSVIDLGFEPQWLMYKNASGSSDWIIMDSMRGIVTGGSDPALYPNKSDAEVTYLTNIDLHPNGFEQTFSSGDTDTYIYMAIRRPHKPAEEFAATDLFALAGNTHSTSNPSFVTGFPVDMALSDGASMGWDKDIATRLTGTKRQETNKNAAEGNQPAYKWDYMNGYMSGSNGSTYGWQWRRAPGYFDVTTYTGVDTNNTQIAHNLGVVPEMIWAKSRSNAQGWNVLTYDGTTGRSTTLNTNNSGATPPSGSIWGNGSSFVPPTSSVFTIGDYSNINTSGATYIAYLFASVAGISKVGSYTGTGNDLNVACGFSAGARFILIKRTDSTGDWYLWDSVRGIVSGNDPYILLNSNAAEVTNTDYVDPLASGFTVTSSAPAALNASGGTYIFYAIA